MSCDISINSLLLTDADIGFFDSNARLQPPLRQQRDRDALAQALADGTIDALVSDHTPVADDAKEMPFAEAEPGATGLELLLPLTQHWAQQQGVPLLTALSRVSSASAQVLGDALGTLQASVGKLVVGGVADLCLYVMSSGVTPVIEVTNSCKGQAFGAPRLPGIHGSGNLYKKLE